jgi:hypothetical protein
VRGPIVFWSLVLLFLLAVYAGLRAIAPHCAAASVATAAAAPAPAAEASATEPAWGGKPLQARVRKTGATVGVGVPPPATGTEPVKKGIGLTPEEAAERIKKGRPALVLFFSTESQKSRDLFPQFVQLTQSPAADRVQVLTFATDQDASAVDTFLRVHQASFDAPLLQPSKPGELNAAMSEIGIKVGKQLDLPFVAVVAPGGEVLGQWPGISDLTPVESVLTKP